MPRMQLTLVYQDDDLVECLLQTIIAFEVEQFIKRQELFNLRDDMCISISNGYFLPNQDIHLKLSLRSDFFPALLNKGTTSEAIASYLVDLSHHYSIRHPLLHNESWLCLSAKQPQEQEEVGYTTFWHYLSPSSIYSSDDTSNHLIDNVVNIVSELAEGTLDEPLQTAFNQLFIDIIDTFGASIGCPQPITSDDASSSLFAIITGFFTATEWPFSQSVDLQSLQLLIQGKYGQWNSYAKVDEENHTFVFYSISPIAAPEEKRMAIAHFLTLANYSTLIGNFELDFSDGEIRYKTSIDVEGDRLTPALIKRLVYTNVAMMDEYLPGIQAVIEQGASPEQAIRLVEQSEAVPSNLSDGPEQPVN